MLFQVIFLAIVLGVAVANPPLLHHEPIHHVAKPYAFGYSVKDHHGEQHREESGHGGAVKGSYGFTDARGVHRQVEYVADGAGFRAQVKTNEPGTANQNPAAVHMISDAPIHHHGFAGHHAGYLGEHHGHHGYGYGGLGNGVAGPYGNYGYGAGYAGPYGGYGYGGYGLGLASGLLGGLGYPRYGY
ncbi:hypothetical protein JTE90_008061 [Oedothorax gibbosus]|uniref:Cuticle protein n=1 Tax=Oedothorax gibbosus TaxID=931172 RepID=A0AAV6UW17_9ARAC|nr:hypothetical protein JTE90_008061 [Oedothorax gibbosus]